MSALVMLGAAWLLVAAQQATLQQAIDLYWNGEYERTLQLLESDPSHALDSALVAPKIVEQFELARQELAARLLEQGKTAYFDGRYDDAFDLLENLLEVDPSSMLGSEYLQLTRERIDLQERAAALAPEEP